MIEEFGMATPIGKKKRTLTRSIKRDPNQVLITKPITALQTDGPISAISSSAGRVNQKRYFRVSYNNTTYKGIIKLYDVYNSKEWLINVISLIIHYSGNASR